MKKTFLSLLLAAAVLLSMSVLGEMNDPEALLGEPMPDFTVTTIEGEVFTLSEVLASKKAVMINLWATWCGPCEMEFPFIQEAYELYQNDVEIIALSVEKNDTDEVLASYALSHGMTFPVAGGTETGLREMFVTEGIPTTVLVDRFGNIVLIEVGAQTSADPFTAVFDVLTYDSYDQTVILNGFPRPKPSAKGSDAGFMAQAVGMPVSVSDDEYMWPFEVNEKNGKACISATNADRNESCAEVLLITDAREGDALRFGACVSSEKAFDRFSVWLDGERVKGFSGETDWFTYAIRLHEGENRIAFRYEKDAMDGHGDDTVYLAEFELLSGEDASKALEEISAYPYAEKTEIFLLNEYAREIRFLDENGSEDTIDMLIGADLKYYILNDDSAVLNAAIAEGTDPEYVLVYSNCDGSSWSADDFLNGSFVGMVDSMEASGYPYSMFILYSDLDVLDGIVVMVDEMNANAFEEELNGYGAELHYVYADGAERGSDELAGGSFGKGTVTYTAVFVDQNGEPVPGCIVNFCTDEMCVPAIADENGYAVFEGLPITYHLQVIRVPDGYEYDTAQEFFVSAEEDDEIVFTVTKK